MKRLRNGIVIGACAVLLTVIGVTSFQLSKQKELTQYYSTGIIKTVEMKDKPVIVDKYKVRYSLSMESLTKEGPTGVVFDEDTKVYFADGQELKSVTLDQLKPDQKVDVTYEYPNDHIVRATEIVIQK